MNKDIIKESLIYDELGLSPIWVTLPKKVEVKNDMRVKNRVKGDLEKQITKEKLIGPKNK